MSTPDEFLLAQLQPPRPKAPWDLPPPYATPTPPSPAPQAPLPTPPQGATLPLRPYIGMSDKELAFLDELFTFLDNEGVAHTPGWSGVWINGFCQRIIDECKLRGISDGTKVVTQTIDLRA